MTGGVGPLALGSIAITGIVVVLLGAGFLVFLPAPRAAQSITLPSSLTSYLPLANPGGITGSGSQATEPAQAGRSSGRTGVGGYLGFASQLDTATRGDLGNQVVMRVRADRPGYFLGMTFDTWTGQNWERSPATSKITTLRYRFTLRRQYGVQPARPTQPGGRRPAEPARPGLARFRLPAGQRPDVLRRPAPGEPVVRDIGANGGLLSRAFADRRSRRLHAVDDRHDARDGVHGHLGRQRGAAERVGEDPARSRTGPAVPPAGSPPPEPVPAGLGSRPPDRQGGRSSDDLCRGDCARGMDEPPCEVLHRHPAAPAGTGRRRPVLVRLPSRLLRADLDLARRHAAHARRAGTRGDRLRTRSIRPAE